ERSQGKPAVRVRRERGKARRRMRQCAPAVHQSSDRVCEQRPSHHGPRHDVGGRDDRLRQDLDEILRQPPDQRRVPEDPVRVEIHGTVKAVPVVKVSVEHEHFVLAKISQGVGAQFFSTIHQTLNAVATGIRPEFVYTTTPPTMVAATEPLSVHPSKGVFFDFDTSDRAWIVTSVSGDSTVRSAGAPSAIVPPGSPSTRAGLADSSSTNLGMLTTPACTRRSRQSGTAVSSPTMPNGARSNSSAFSSAWCGA